MSVTINSFEECLNTSSSGKRHLLLGNGFSRACRNDIFSYDSLFDSANFNKLSKNIPNVFKSLATTDFEKVMQALESTHRVLAIYDRHGSEELIESLQKDSVQLKNVLVETISSHHPEAPSNVSDDEFRNCIHFLKNFEKIYSTNYDLLLYWTTMKASEFGESERDDGFRDPYFGDPDNYEESDYVDWQNSDYKQDIHYLHGALHLYYSEGTLKKYCWSRTGIRLLNQINEALENKMYPLIVAEGTSSQKLDKIQHSNYLGHNYRSLRKVSGSLFVYGLSFSENDLHISEQIRKNTALKNVYISIYGSRDSNANKELVKNSQRLKENRPPKKPLNLYYYNAESARVWG